ncbi:hypothetical protein ABUW04_38005 [Streptacidiphilus sp. N1-10]|uniref:Chaplin domain-containing protein n=1 Tax=Streptacidiphilus jeojiensis TaxID=3229225 RepID=A0ABV6Y0Y2_9ACTN
MERSVKSMGVAAVAVAILAGGAGSAFASTAKPDVFCAAGKASLVKISDQALDVGAVSCSQGDSN